MKIHMLRSNDAHLHREDKFAEAPPKLRPWLRVPAFHNPMTQKKRETFVPLFCVPGAGVEPARHC